MAILLDLEILFGLAILTVLLVRRLALPSIIGFLAAGKLPEWEVPNMLTKCHTIMEAYRMSR